MSAPAGRRRRASGLGGLLVLVLAARAFAGDAPPPVPDPERKTVTLANGLRMGYVELGDPGQPPLVFLHGYTNSSLGYLPLGRLLAKHHHVFLLDQRGHGASDKPECCYSRLDFAYDVKLFLDRMGLERADVAGHSLGGMIAPTVAAYWPERVDHLVIVASTLGRRSRPSPDAPQPEPVLKGWDAEIRKLKDPIDPDSPFLKSWWDVPGVDPAQQALMRRESARIPAAIWRAILDQGEVSADLRSTAHLVRAPTLLLFGGKDALFGADDDRELAAWLPHARTVTLPALGHSMPEEDPGAVAGVVLEFLDAGGVSARGR